MTQLGRTSAITGIALFLETCTFYLLVTIITVIMDRPDAGLPFWLVFLALAWAFLLSFYLQTLRFSLSLRGAMGLGVSVFSILMLTNLNTRVGFFPIGDLLSGDGDTVFALIMSLAFLVLLWWRGARLSQDDLTLDTLRGSFQWGLGVIFLAVIADSMNDADIINGFLVVGFFGLGLAGMSLARFSSETGNSDPMSVNWLVPIGASIGAVLGLGLIISALGIGGLDDVTRAIMGFVGQVALWVLKPVFLLIGYVVELLVRLGNWLSSVFGGGDLSGLERAQQEIEAFHQSLEAEREDVGPPAALVMFLKVVTFLAVSLLAGWLLYLLFRFRRFLRPKGEVQEVRESMFSWQRANQDIANLIGDWWRNLVSSAVGEDKKLPDPRTPREFYHAMLSLASRLGRSRQDYQTPREHQRSLTGVLPPEPVARIVDDFQMVHYGGGNVGGEELERLRQSWEALRNRLADDGQGKTSL